MNRLCSQRAWRWRQAAVPPMLMVLASGLGGCASLGAPLSPAPSATAATEASTGVAYEVEVDAPGPLRGLLARHLDLARFQALSGDDRITPTDLNRLVQTAPAQARALLETEGHFNAKVTVARTSGDQNTLPRVTVTVLPGPRTGVASVQWVVQGPLQQARAAGDASADGLVLKLQRDWKLTPGSAFRQSAWTDAKSASLAQARANGYPAAAWSRTEARIDAAKDAATLTLALDSGPLFRFGPLSVEGLQRYQRAAVDNLATFRTGTPYSDKLVLDFQERLQRANLFESAAVEVATDPAQAEASPVTVRLKELPKNQTDLGLGYSDATGQRVSVEHLNRRFMDQSFFGTDLIARSKLALGRDLQSLEAALTTHPMAGANRYFVSGKLQREQLDGAQVRSGNLRAGRSFESERIDRQVFAEGVAAKTRSPTGDRLDRSLTGNVHVTWRRLDSALLPTEGHAWHVELGAGYAQSDVALSGPFGRALARYTHYRPLGGQWLGSARLEAAQVVSKPNVGVPDTLLFRAGGDESVRGYAHRSLGPLVNGAVASGRVLMTGSLEATRPLLDSLPTLQGAVFVDAGAAATRWGELSPVLGYGVGLRLRSPVGPLRLDLAYGQELRAFRLHFGVGITF